MSQAFTIDKFINEHFLLHNEFAQRLYHQFAANQPIIDYHNHLPPAEIQSNRQFENLSQIWLAGDHYKWRAMRTLGINENYITGSASDWKKFEKWAYTVPYTVRNPLYHWTHLELKRYFGVEELLSQENAKSVYETCNEQLAQPGFKTQGLLSKMNVEVVCTTDDPTDSLENHRQFSQSDSSLQMYPAFRPDKAYSVEIPSIYNTYLEKLEKQAGLKIQSYEDLLAALQNRIDFFHANGCRLSDHGLEQLVFFSNRKIQY